MAFNNVAHLLSETAQSDTDSETIPLSTEWEKAMHRMLPPPVGSTAKAGITSYYGMRDLDEDEKTGTDGKEDFHGGIDFNLKTSGGGRSDLNGVTGSCPTTPVPVYAPIGGTVTISTNMGGVYITKNNWGMELYI